MDPREGGPSEAIRNFISELENSNVYCEVVSFDDPNSSFLLKDDFNYSLLGPAQNPWSYQSKFPSWLRKNLLRFDVVIVHGLWLYNNYAVYTATRHFKKFLNFSGDGKMPRIYIMPHGMLNPYYQTAPGRKLKAIRNWFYWKLIENKTVNSADGLLFTCKEELQLARLTHKPYKPRKELLVGLGITDPPQYNSIMRNEFVDIFQELKDKSYFLFLSRIHEIKGIDILLLAYSKIIRMYAKAIKNGISKLVNITLDNKLPKLVIAGPGIETRYGKKIQRIVAQDKLLSDNVIFAGMLSGNLKWGAFYGCEAFVLPSHHENFGIAIVEALACSKSVIISNKVNIWREIEMMNCGLISDDSLNGLYEALKSWIFLSAEEKQKLNNNARIAFENKFSIQSVTSILLNELMK
jgi:glycosyltransferase involved in cell wall biosynthesis